MYWIWKNTHGQDYVGIEHYRRRLMISDNLISKIGKDDIDVITSLPQFVMKPVNEFFINSLISRVDWELIEKSIGEVNPEYIAEWDKFQNAWFYFSCNLCLMKRHLFELYCEFAFSIAFKIEKAYVERKIYRSDRYMGYIFEILFSLFLMRYYDELEIKCSEVEWIEAVK